MSVDDGSIGGNSCKNSSDWKCVRREESVSAMNSDLMAIIKDYCGDAEVQTHANCFEAFIPHPEYRCGSTIIRRYPRYLLPYSGTPATISNASFTKDPRVAVSVQKPATASTRCYDMCSRTLSLRHRTVFPGQTYSRSTRALKYHSRHSNNIVDGLTRDIIPRGPPPRDQSRSVFGISNICPDTR